jgi:hypothetical protein
MYIHICIYSNLDWWVIEISYLGIYTYICVNICLYIYVYMSVYICMPMEFETELELILVDDRDILPRYVCRYLY